MSRAKTRRRKDFHHEEHDGKDDGKTINISTSLLYLAAFPSQPSDQARSAFGMTISYPQSLISPLCVFAPLREFFLLSELLEHFLFILKY